MFWKNVSSDMLKIQVLPESGLDQEENGEG
jgi:hypothetical protein